MALTFSKKELFIKSQTQTFREFNGFTNITIDKGDTETFTGSLSFNVDGIEADTFDYKRSDINTQKNQYQSIDLNHTVPNFSVSFSFSSSYSSHYTFSNNTSNGTCQLTCNSTASEMGVANGAVVGQLIVTINHGGTNYTHSIDVKASNASPQLYTVVKTVVPNLGTISNIQYKATSSSSWTNWNGSSIQVDMDEAQSYRAYFTLPQGFSNGKGEISVFSNNQLVTSQSVNIASGGAWVSINNINPSPIYDEVEFRLFNGRPNLGGLL